LERSESESDILERSELESESDIYLRLRNPAYQGTIRPKAGGRHHPAPRAHVALSFKAYFATLVSQNPNLKIIVIF